MNTSDAFKKLKQVRNKLNRAETILLCSALSPLLLLALALISKKIAMAIFPIYFPIMMISVIVSFFRMIASSATFKDLYKQIFVISVLKESFSNVIYDWERGFSSNTVKKFGLCELGNRFKSEDYLSASYKDIKFEMADVTIEHESGSGNTSHTTTYFGGRMLAFEFPKNNITSVQLRSKDFKHLAKNPFGYDMKGISMESVSFNRDFRVTSANEHDAFYVLTPHLMDSIQRIYSKYRNVAMHFAGNKLYVGLDGCSDTFDFPGDKHIIYEVEQERIKKDIQDIMEIIDTITQND